MIQAARRPFEIGDGVIPLVPIHVVHHWEVERIRDKSHSDEAMKPKRLHAALTPQGDVRVGIAPLAYTRRHHYLFTASCFHGSVGIGNRSLARAQASVIRHLIQPLPSSHVAPFLFLGQLIRSFLMVPSFSRQVNFCGWPRSSGPVISNMRNSGANTHATFLSRFRYLEIRMPFDTS